MMNFYLISLRLIHVFAGVFWVGAAFMLAGFIEPTVRAAGPEGGRFMQRLTQQTRFVTFMSLAAILTPLSGLLLYWRVSGGLQLAWITSPAGLILTVGAAAGLLESILGFSVNRPTALRMAALAQQLQAASGPPASAQLAELQSLQEKFATALVRGAVILAVALIGMSLPGYVAW